MKNLKAILVTTLASLFAVLTVVNMSLASPRSAGENTLDMLEIMTRAFDESEGGDGEMVFCYEDLIMIEDQNWWKVYDCEDCKEKNCHTYKIDLLTCYKPIVP